MKAHLFASALFLNLISCSKSDSGAPPRQFEAKLVGKVWKMGGEPPLLSMQFNPDKSGLERAMRTILPNVTYFEYPFTWRLDGDSVRLKMENYNDWAFRIYDLSDSVLTTNNWVLGGISDTVSVQFRVY